MVQAMASKGLLPLSISRADVCFSVEVTELQRESPPPMGSIMLNAVHGARLIPKAGMLIERPAGVLHCLSGWCGPSPFTNHTQGNPCVLVRDFIG